MKHQIIRRLREDAISGNHMESDAWKNTSVMVCAIYIQNRHKIQLSLHTLVLSVHLPLEFHQIRLSRSYSRDTLWNVSLVSYCIRLGLWEVRGIKKILNNQGYTSCMQDLITYLSMWLSWGPSWRIVYRCLHRWFYEPGIPTREEEEVTIRSILTSLIYIM